VNLALLGAGEDALLEIAKERHPRYRHGLAVTHCDLGHQEASDAALIELKRSPRPMPIGSRGLAAQGKRA